MPIVHPQQKVPVFRRWRVPLATSVVINLIAMGVAGNWFARKDVSPPRLISLQHVVFVPPPQTATKPKRTIVPRLKLQPIDKRPQQPNSPKRTDAATTRAGARHAPVQLANTPHITPHSAAPQNQEKNVDRDPFQPDVAPALAIPQPTHAQNTVALPSPPARATVKPTQIASVTGTGQTFAPTPSPTPASSPATRPATGLASEPGPVRVGSGGQGQGERGAGAGAGGVLPFGLGGGRGGEGDHYILYLLDFSPSMVSRLPDLRAEIERSMDTLSPDDLFDIFAFGDHVVKMEDYLEPATPDSIAEARRFMSHMGVIDGTNIEEVMLEALSLHHTNQIVLITDGVPEDGETDFKSLEREIRLANIHHIQINTIGLIGVNDFNNAATTFEAAQLLRTIAEESGGYYKLVPLGVDSPE